jgi:hypothetical protein
MRRDTQELSMREIFGEEARHLFEEVKIGDKCANNGQGSLIGWPQILAAHPGTQSAPVLHAPLEKLAGARDPRQSKKKRFWEAEAARREKARERRSSSPASKQAPSPDPAPTQLSHPPSLYSQQPLDLPIPIPDS